jgi:hypothetical protein
LPTVRRQGRTLHGMTGHDDEQPVDEVRELVLRLARPHRSGGHVVERAALLAEGGDVAATLAWVEAHGGRPETEAAPKATGGLHGARDSSTGATRPPQRFVLPAGALR